MSVNAVKNSFLTITFPCQSRGNSMGLWNLYWLPWWHVTQDDHKTLLVCVQYVSEILCLREGSLQRQQQFSDQEKTDYCPHTLTLKASLQAVRMPVWFQICLYALRALETLHAPNIVINKEEKAVGVHQWHKDRQLERKTSHGNN